jgi:hypothetical protein
MSKLDIEQALQAVLSPGNADGLDCSAALYRHVAGESSARESMAFRTHLNICEQCRADLGRFNAATIETEERPAQRLGLRMSVWIRRLVIAAAGAGMVFLLWSHSVPIYPPAKNSVVLRAKGSPALHVAVNRDGRTMNWAAMDSLLPGDDLRFSYSTPSSTYPVLFGVDESGNVARIFPEGGPILREAGGGVLGTAQVDTQPGCQWLVAYFFHPDQVPNLGTISVAVHDAVEKRRGNDCQLGSLDVVGGEVDVKAKRVLPR